MTYSLSITPWFTSWSKAKSATATRRIEQQHDKIMTWKPFLHYWPWIKRCTNCKDAGDLRFHDAQIKACIIRKKLLVIYSNINLVSISSNKGVPPVQCQTITWTKNWFSSTELLLRGTNFSEILINFSFQKIHVNVYSAKCQPFNSGHVVLFCLHYGTESSLCLWGHIDCSLDWYLHSVSHVMQTWMPSISLNLQEILEGSMSVSLKLPLISGPQ